MHEFKLTYAVLGLDESHVFLFDELYSLLGSNFKVIINYTPKAIKTGKTPFVRSEYEVNYYLNTNFAKKLLSESDAIVISNTNNEIKKIAMHSKKKLVYIEGERSRKNKFTVKEEIMHRIGMFIHHKIYQRKNLFYLCIGSYVESDLNKYHLYKNRCIPWGYWPYLKIENPINKKWDNKNVNLVYIGQMISIKRPEISIHIAKLFIAKGFCVQLDFLGSGTLLEDFKKLSTEKIPNLNITIHGRVPLDEVKDMLQKAHFYLSTSDYHDGWNMVTNQSLECGTPVIANNEVGSTNSLIINNYNGCVFSDDNMDLIINNFIDSLNINSFNLLTKNALSSFQNFSPKAKAAFLIKEIKNHL